MAIEEGTTSRAGGSRVQFGIDGYGPGTVIGRGDFGVVYRARQRALRRTVAVKVLSEATIDDAALARFDRQRVAVGALSGHPNIVAVYDSGLTAGGEPYVAMEYFARGSLAEELDRLGLVDWRQVLQWGIKLAGALESAHRLDVVH